MSEMGDKPANDSSIPSGSGSKATILTSRSMTKAPQASKNECTTKELDSAIPEALGKRVRTAEAAEPDVPPAQQKVQVKSNVGTASLSLRRRCSEMELQAKMQRSSDEVNQDTFNVPLAALGPNSTERVRGKAGPLEVKIIMGKSANGKVKVIIGVKN